MREIRAFCIGVIVGALLMAAMLTFAPVMLAFAQQPKAVDTAPIVPDKIALAIRTGQLQQARDKDEFNQLLATDVGKRLVELQKKLNEASAKLQTLSKGICGDEKVWALDPDSLKCVPAPKPEAAKISPSPSPK